jgi:PTH1 family peptidyl-tRNA hydrolase
VRLVLGLGNPGARYERTRHNVAWWVLDVLASRHTAREAPGQPDYRARRITLAGHDVELLQPLTYMNLSGEALQAWRERNGIESDLLVVTDDVYLPAGSLRLRAGGSPGGHRGLESIEAAVGGPGYARLRIGVGAAQDAAALRSHVLEEFSPAEAPVIEEAVRLAADAVECWVSEGALGAMNRFNRRVRQEESET